MIASLAAVLGGLVVLVWSADRFVAGAAALAGHYRVAPLLIGMVIVGFGTSAPELTVSTLSALGGTPALALGNAWGSNSVNIGLILGLTAVLAPLAVRSGILRREMPILLAVTALTLIAAADLRLSRWEGLALLAAFTAFMVWSWRQARGAPEDALAGEVEPEVMAPGRAALWTALGLVLLVLASRALVWGAVRIASDLGVSELVIGLTVVAIGTSLPELAASLAAVRRRAHEIALGNVLGSNMFNTLAVAGIAVSIAPAELPAAALWRDLGVMTGLTVLLCAFALPLWGRAGRLNRIEGAALMAIWIGYTGWLIAAAAGAPGLAPTRALS